MSEKRTLEKLFYCGRVLVEVGFNSVDRPEAQTNSTFLNCADLGGEISVKLYEDVLEEAEDGAIYVKPEAWAELLREMRDMLARCMILGRMEVASGGLMLDMDEENSMSIQEAEKLLGEEFFDITFDTAMRALKERCEEEKVRDGLRMMINMMAEESLRRGLNKEERGRMTVREAFGPKEENEGED
jgi:hypothetical protein